MFWRGSWRSTWLGDAGRSCCGDRKKEEQSSQAFGGEEAREGVVLGKVREKRVVVCGVRGSSKFFSVPSVWVRTFEGLQLHPMVDVVWKNVLCFPEF